MEGLAVPVVVVYTYNMRTVGERLHEAREAAGLTQRQAGSLLSISNTVISDLEAGRRRLTLRLATGLSEYYGVSIDWLLTGKERPIDAETRAELAKLDPKDRAAIEHLLGRLATRTT